MSFHVQWLKIVPRNLPWGSSPTLSSPSSLISLHCPIHTFHIGLAGFSLPQDHNRYLVLPGWIILLPPLIPHMHTPHHYLLLYFFNHSKLPNFPSSTYLAFVKSMPHSFNFRCVLPYNKEEKKHTGLGTHGLVLLWLLITYMYHVKTLKKPPKASKV